MELIPTTMDNVTTIGKKRAFFFIEVDRQDDIYTIVIKAFFEEKKNTKFIIRKGKGGARTIVNLLFPFVVAPVVSHL
jgi:hypothetical protein